MKLIIFSDIDGTLYGEDKKVSAGNKKAIKEFMDKGHEFVITTGNPYIDKMPILSSELNTRYLINSNGASIYDKKAAKFLFVAKIKNVLANKILNYANANQIGADWWDEEHVYANEFVNNQAVEAIKKSCLPNDEIVKADSIENDIFKIEFYDEKNKIDEAEVFLKTLGLQTARMSLNHIEITDNNVSKGEAIKILLGHLGIEEDNAMSIGDSQNDFSMLKLLKHSFAMGNAKSDIHAIANNSTDHADNDGLAKAIDTFYGLTKK